MLRCLLVTLPYRRVAGLVAVFLTSVAPLASAQRVTSTAHVRGSLETTEQASDSTVSVRLTLVIASGWHIGAPQPGSSGLPTTVVWKLPSGWKVSAMRWPKPHTGVLAGDTLFTYEGYVPIEAFFVASRRPTAGRIRAVVSFGACRADFCVPGHLFLDLALRSSHDHAHS
jgi:DsbC/DsbD-like thiol-disulfide interchange protein